MKRIFLVIAVLLLCLTGCEDHHDTSGITIEEIPTESETKNIKIDLDERKETEIDESIKESIAESVAESIAESMTAVESSSDAVALETLDDEETEESSEEVEDGSESGETSESEEIEYDDNGMPIDRIDNDDLVDPEEYDGDDIPLVEMSNYYICPDSDIRLYSHEELSTLTPYELFMARCEIYARRGMIFEDKEVQKYFEGQEWYTPRINESDFSMSEDSIFNQIEISNRDLMTNIQIERNQRPW